MSGCACLSAAELAQAIGLNNRLNAILMVASAGFGIFDTDFIERHECTFYAASRIDIVLAAIGVPDSTLLFGILIEFSAVFCSL